MINVITTVGTSLFENAIKTNDNYNIKDKYVDLKDKTYSQMDTYKQDVQRLKNSLKNFMRNDKDASAEIKSLLSIQNKFKDDLEVYFICSDSILSNLAAEIIKDNLKNENIIFRNIIPIEGLSINDTNKFISVGLNNLISELYNIFNGYSPSYLLNITGGFKGVIPFLTIWGQTNNIKSVYIFEDSSTLITIPQMPINIDWEIFEKYSALISQLDSCLNISKEEFIRKNIIPENFPDIIQEEKVNSDYLIGLNPLGKILWEKYKNFYIVSAVKTFYTKYDTNKINLLNKAIIKLLVKLDSLSEERNEFESLRDTEIKHCNLPDNTFGYKYSEGSTQIRIHYKWEDNKLTLYNSMFIEKTPDDHKYSQIFETDYQNNKNLELVNLTFQKEIK